MRYRDPIPTFRALYHFGRRNMTAGGKACLLGMLCSLIGLVYLETPLVYLFCALFALLIAGAVASFILRPRLIISTIAPASVAAGETAELEVYLRNPHSRPTYDLTVSLVDLPNGCRVPDGIRPFIAEADRNRTIRACLPFQADQRGVFAWPRVRVTSAFPFNLFRFRQSQRIEGELIVRPQYHPLHNFDLSRIIRVLLGSQDSSANRVGMSDQYFGNREYQSGIAVRRWDYCSWARLGQPVVREYHDTQHRAVEIFADNFPSPDPNYDKKLEAILSLTMSLAHEVSRDHGFVSCLSLGSKQMTCASESPTEQMASVGLQLALAVPETPQSWKKTIQSEQGFRSDAALILAIFNGWNDDRQQLHRWLLASGCAVKPIIVIDSHEPLPQHLPVTAECVFVQAIESGTVEFS